MKKNKLLFVATLSAACLFSLASCQGAQGPKGDQGEPGINGTNGTNGINGTNGSSVLTGKGEPASTLGTDGDSYIDTDTFDFYSKESGAWSKIGNIKGSTGEQGSQGEQGEEGKKGSSLLSGSGAPSSELGSDGDSYIDTSTFDFYSKTDGEWKKYGNFKGADGTKGEEGTKGEDGKQGTSVLTGSGAPASTLGSDGDSYIDTSSFDFYTKSNGSWSKVGNIKGEKGDTGEKGDKGNTGWSGSKGDKGETAYSNTILPVNGGYVVPSVGSATVGQTMRFTMYPQTDPTRYTCSELKLIASDGNNKTYTTTDFKVDTTTSLFYVDEVPMVAGGYVVKATFIENTKQNITPTSVTDRYSITVDDSKTEAYVGDKVSFTITELNGNKITYISGKNGTKDINIGVEKLEKVEDGVYKYTTIMEGGGDGITIQANYDSYNKLQISKSGDETVEVYKGKTKLDNSLSYVLEKDTTVTLKIKAGTNYKYFKSLSVSVGGAAASPVNDWSYDFDTDTYSKDITVETSDVSVSIVFATTTEDLTAREYKIGSKAELEGFREKINTDPDFFYNSTITLTKDIDLGGEEWTPISGIFYNKNITFKGGEDAEHKHTISNFKVSDGYEYKSPTIDPNVNLKDFGGFFGIAYGITIENLNIDKATIDVTHYAGGIVGYGAGVIIKNCSVTNSKITASVKDDDNGDKVGSIIGYLGYDKTDGITPEVSNCEAGGNTLTGFRDIGGLVGISNPDASKGKPLVKNNTITGNISLIDNHSKVYGNKRTFTNFGNYIGRNDAGSDTTSNSISSEAAVTIEAYICDGLKGKFVNDHYEYEISTADGLRTLSTYVNKEWVDGKKADGITDNVVSSWLYYTTTTQFKITKEIDLENKEFTPMNLNRCIFDGGKNWIKNLNINGTLDVGLIGGATGTTIKDVYIKDSTIKGMERVGAVAGGVCEGQVSGCVVENTDVLGLLNTVEGGEAPTKIGGVIGDFDATGEVHKIENCSVSNCNIYGGSKVGGIVGRVRKKDGGTGTYYIKGNKVTNSCLYGVYEDTDKYNIGEFGEIVGLYLYFPNTTDCTYEDNTFDSVNKYEYKEHFSETYDPTGTVRKEVNN